MHVLAWEHLPGQTGMLKGCLLSLLLPLPTSHLLHALHHQFAAASLGDTHTHTPPPIGKLHLTAAASGHSAEMGTNLISSARRLPEKWWRQVKWKGRRNEEGREEKRRLHAPSLFVKGRILPTPYAHLSLFSCMPYNMCMELMGKEAVWAEEKRRRDLSTAQKHQ